MTRVATALVLIAVPTSENDSTWTDERRIPLNTTIGSRPTNGTTIKLLNVSVTGTMQDGWSIEQLADDYAACAEQAARHGADSIEIHLSCPNVSTCDGQLYQHPLDAAVVAQQVRQSIGQLPLIVKIGHFQDDRQLPQLLDALAPHVDMVATTNSIVARVVDGRGQPCFDGQSRGICGCGILDASVRQTEALADYISRQSLGLSLVGVGGIFHANDVKRYLSAGAESVQLATAAMIDPEVGLKIRTDLNGKL